MILVSFHSPTSPPSVDEFEGTVTELILDLLTDEWPYEFVSVEGTFLTFKRVNIDDYATFDTIPK